MVALLGANGAGKTTLNRTLSGVLRARAGRIRFAGQDITQWDPAAIVRAGLIHVPEGRKIFPTLSVRENLLLGAYARGRAERTRTLDRVLATFPRLRERLPQIVGSMSGGEQQMVAIGRGLMSQPKLLILDEPSLGLSPLLVEELFAPGRRRCTRPGCPSCWSSRTFCNRLRSRAGPMSWSTVRWRSPGRPPCCRTTRG